MISYLDTSAALKLLVVEEESTALRSYWREATDVDAFGSWLLHTELHRAARRQPEVIDRDVVSRLLDSVNLVDVTRGDFLTAGAFPWRLRSHDALHLAVALRIDADVMITYDEELVAATHDAGLVVMSPR